MFVPPLLWIDRIRWVTLSGSSKRCSGCSHWLDELMPRIQAHSQARINELIPWYESADGCSGIAKFYRQLAGLELDGNRALAQIGWGSGWDGKTFWTHLQKDARLFEQIISDFRMHRGQRGAPPRQVGDPFPRSRRAAMKVKEGSATPAAPFGWSLVELEEKS